MLQLWKLVLLCGLLTGTSALSLGNIVSDLTNSDNLKSVLSTVTSKVEGLLQNLNGDLNLANISENILEILNSVNIAGKTFLDGLNVSIKKLRFLDLKPELSSDGASLTLKVPVEAEVSVGLPVVGKLVDAVVNLTLVNGVTLQVDPQTGLQVAVAEKCTRESDNLSISLLGRQVKLVNTIVDGASSTLKNVVSSVLENQVCPLIKVLVSILNPVLSETLISNVAKSVLDGSK